MIDQLCEYIGVRIGGGTTSGVRSTRVHVVALVDGDFVDEMHGVTVHGAGLEAVVGVADRAAGLEFLWEEDGVGHAERVLEISVHGVANHVHGVGQRGGTGTDERQATVVCGGVMHAKHPARGEVFRFVGLEGEIVVVGRYIE